VSSSLDKRSSNVFKIVSIPLVSCELFFNRSVRSDKFAFSYDNKVRLCHLITLFTFSSLLVISNVLSSMIFILYLLMFLV
jgi:hypothetical protein